MLYKYRIFIVFICCAQVTYLYGQTPTYVHYDVSDGLPGNIVYCAAQDERGFMWFGTDKGLACFDGTRFRIFGVKDGLPDPEVLNIKLDSQERLWVFCFRKNPCYFYKGKLYTEKEDKVLGEIGLDGGVGDFMEDKENGIWFTGNKKYLFLISVDLKIVKKILSETVISSLAFVKGKLIGLDIRICRVVESTKISNKIIFKNNAALGSTYFGNGNTDRGLLISTSSGTYLIQTDDFSTFKDKLVSQTNGRVYIDKLKNSWICSSEHGAVCFLRSDSTFSTPLHFLNNKKTTITFQDNHFGYWFCTSGEGVYYLPANHSLQYSSQAGLVSNNITTVNYTSQYGYVGGDDQGNLYSFSNHIERLNPIQIAGVNRSRHIFDQKQELLIVNDAGLTRFDGKKSITYSKLKATKYLIHTANGLYVGTASNIYQIVDSDFENPRIIRAGRTTAAAHDPESNLWIGGIDGIYTETDSFKQNWGEKFPALKNRIITLDSDKKHLWAVTPNDGLLKMTVKNRAILDVDTMNTHLHTPIDNIQALHLEENGRIWLATNTGVYGINNNGS